VILLQLSVRAEEGLGDDFFSFRQRDATVRSRTVAEDVLVPAVQRMSASLDVKLTPRLS
jgi:hypothetical protein